MAWQTWILSEWKWKMEILIILLYLSVNKWRVPKEGHLRNAWINSIEKQQIYDHYKLRFRVCEQHFTETDFSIDRHGKKTRKKDAVPSLFVENGDTEQSSVDAENGIFPTPKNPHP